MGLFSICIALQLMTALIIAEDNDTGGDYPPISEVPVLDFTTSFTTSSSSAGGPGEFGMHDPSPYPTIDSYPETRTVQAGDSAEFSCTASDKADHVGGLHKHDLSVEIYYEKNPARDLSDVEHQWYESISINTRARPSFLTQRVDITETGEVSIFKQQVTLKDDGWYVCRACIQKDRPTESCDINDARFYLHVLENKAPEQREVKGSEEPTVTTPNPYATEFEALKLDLETPRSTCQVFGDPHVMTFDGHTYTLAGSSCHYILALDAHGSRWFVYGRFGPCGAIAQGFCLESVIIYSRSDAVELQRGWLVNRGGEKIETRDLQDTLEVGEFEVEFVGTNLEVRLLLGEEIPEPGVKVQAWLKVSWDGLTAVTIESPSNDRTQGLCGNNDQNPDNDFNIWGTSNSDELFFSESTKVDVNRECESGQAAHTAESIEELCGDRLDKVRRKCNRIFTIRPFEWCSYDREPYYNACVYDECKGFNINSNLYSWMQIPNVDRVLSPGCAAAEAYARKCSLKSWTEEGDIIASVDTEGWELMTRACPIPATKLEYIPKLGCPQSFMPEVQ